MRRKQNVRGVGLRGGSRGGKNGTGCPMWQRHMDCGLAGGALPEQLVCRGCCAMTKGILRSLTKVDPLYGVRWTRRRGHAGKLFLRP